MDLADRWGGTALTAALRHGHLAIAKMLMSCEAKLGSHTDPDLVQVSLTRPAATVTATDHIQPTIPLKRCCQSAALELLNLADLC